MRSLALSLLSTTSWLYQGIKERDEGDLLKAVESFSKATQLYPNDAQGWYEKGNVLNRLLRFREGVMCCQRSILEDPGKFWGHCYLGFGLIGLGRYQEALECLDRAIALNPKVAQGYCHKGYALNCLGRNQEALEFYGIALGVDPKYGRAWSRKGVSLMQLGRVEESLECVEKAIQNINKSAESDIWLDRGYVFMMLERFSEAKRCFEIALQSAVEKAVARFYVAFVVDVMGEWENAKSVWNECEHRELKDLWLGYLKIHYKGPLGSFFKPLLQSLPGRRSEESSQLPYQQTVPQISPQGNLEKRAYKLMVIWDGQNYRVDANVISLDELYEAISKELKMSFTIHSISYWDEDFQEYILLNSLDHLPTKAKININMNMNMNINPSLNSVTPGTPNRRSTTPTFRSKPGDNFLRYVPTANTSWETIIQCLQKWTEVERNDSSLIVKDAIDKYYLLQDKYPHDECMAFTLLWLYSLDSWVYNRVNQQLRDDRSGLEILAPFIKSLMSISSVLKTRSYFFSGCVYRRCHLSLKDLDEYQINKTFLWSSFTSTTSVFDPNDTFGRVLFLVIIPERFDMCAISIQQFSAFASEQEILLVPYLGYRVISKEKDTSFANTDVVIKLVVEWSCLF